MAIYAAFQAHASRMFIVPLLKAELQQIGQIMADRAKKGLPEAYLFLNLSRAFGYYYWAFSLKLIPTQSDRHQPARCTALSRRLIISALVGVTRGDDPLLASRR